MSIRYLAIGLYQAMKKVEDLRLRLEKTDSREREQLEAELRAAGREYEHMRKMMASKKEL